MSDPQKIAMLKMTLVLLRSDANYAYFHPECHNRAWFMRMRTQADLALDELEKN